LQGVHALPFLIALVSAAILAPVILRALDAGGHTKANYRGRQLPCPFGVLMLAAGVVALIPLMLVQRWGPAKSYTPRRCR
jgi:hypothetical protein